MTVTKKESIIKCGAWAGAGVVVGAGSMFMWQLGSTIGIASSWNLSSEITMDTVGTWTGTLATILIAIIGWVYGGLLLSQRRRAESLQVSILASEVQFRIRPILGPSATWTKWRIVLYTDEKAPATDVQVYLDDQKLGDMLPLLRLTQNSPWGWQPEMALEMPEPTRDEEKVYSYIRSNLRQRVEVRFTMQGYRFSRTTRQLTFLGKA